MAYYTTREFAPTSQPKRKSYRFFRAFRAFRAFRGKITACAVAAHDRRVAHQSSAATTLTRYYSAKFAPK